MCRFALQNMPFCILRSAISLDEVTAGGGLNAIL